MPEKLNQTPTTELEDDATEQKSTLYDLFLAALAFISLLNIIALLILPHDSQEYVFISFVDIFLALAFMADFIFNFFRAKHKLEYMRWGWIALLAGIPVFPSMPPIFNLVRFARLIRLVQILHRLRMRSGRQLWTDVIRQRARGTLLGMILIGGVLLVISSFLIVRFESGAPGAEIDTVTEGFYWGLITITTVGYGDFVPVTFQGRTLAGIITILGIIIVAVATSYVTQSFQGGSSRQDDFDQMVKDVAEVKQLLQQLLEETSVGDEVGSE
ncbi:MAG: ion transporter [Anaerolineae bacterium]|nr:ion transporter [Anaerolineae bacterium]